MFGEFDVRQKMFNVPKFPRIFSTILPQMLYLFTVNRIAHPVTSFHK